MERVKYYRTDFLYPKLSMVTGMGTIFNLAGRFFNFNYSENPDKKAIDADWGVVGMDMAKTVEQNPVKSFAATSLNG